MPDCLFCRIRDDQVPAKVVYQDDRVIAFRDIQPQAPTHVLIVPRKHVPSLAEAAGEDGALLGHMALVAARIARDENLEGFRTVINNGQSAGQSVWHLHLHLLGGRPMRWPPG
jgi:histidine triad (HIT) family protein